MRSQPSYSHAELKVYTFIQSAQNLVLEKQLRNSNAIKIQENITFKTHEYKTATHK